jgi:hypothetical protein
MGESDKGRGSHEKNIDEQAFPKKIHTSASNARSVQKQQGWEIDSCQVVARKQIDFRRFKLIGGSLQFALDFPTFFRLVLSSSRRDPFGISSGPSGVKCQPNRSEPDKEKQS